MADYTVFTNLKATGEIAAGGEAAVTGAATVGGAAAVTGNATVGGGLDVIGNASVGGNLGVTGNLAVTGNIIVTGALTAPGAVKLIELGSIGFDAVSGEAAALYTLPEGAVLIKAFCTVTETFDSGDGDVLILGTADSGDALMASADITETAAATYQKEAWLIGGEEGTAILATLTKTGTAATKGAATFRALLCCPAGS